MLVLGIGFQTEGAPRVFVVEKRGAALAEFHGWHAAHEMATLIGGEVAQYRCGRCGELFKAGDEVIELAGSHICVHVQGCFDFDNDEMA